MDRGAAQVHALWRVQGQGVRLGEEHGLPIAQPQEARHAWPAAEVGTTRQQHCVVLIRKRTAVRIQHHDVRARPQDGQRIGVGAEVVGAVKRAIDEGERAAALAHTVKDDPQPQVVLAFGLRITNCAPCRLSL